MSLRIRVTCRALAIGALSCSIQRTSQCDTKAAPPPALREFRAAWVATVANIDWPSKPGLSSTRQKSELVAILNKAAELNLNAIVLQVRPACDALYKSNLEPWSEYITGEMGHAPDPFYDPLSFAVTEAHKRGIELHAWFNPYRAHHPTGKSSISDDHISKIHPNLVKSYGKYLWLDPGEPAVQNHSIRVIMDVVKRYDIDGVHLDDYFYPYKEKDSVGQFIDFPDEPSWKKYIDGGGVRGREDWRRENVNSFVQRLYKSIKTTKKWVKFGISPFGIWRPGNPSQIKGYDQYDMLYADARKWLNYGWVDYWTPQLYWKIDPPDQSYPVLLKWWVDENTEHRHVWPGNYTSRVGGQGADNWPAAEIVNQIKKTRDQAGATGNVHFSMKALLQNRGGLADSLRSTVYAQPALVPSSPWLAGAPLHKPAVSIRRDPTTGSPTISWKPTKGEKPWLWTVTYQVGEWATKILPGVVTELKDLGDRKDLPAVVSVCAVDRYGVTSPPALIQLRASRASK